MHNDETYQEKWVEKDYICWCNDTVHKAWVSIWLTKEVFSIPSAFLPSFWTTAAKAPCNGVGHILEASSNFTWHMFLWGTPDLNDHREFSPKEAQSFDWGGHRIKAQCTDHGTPLQPTEPHPSPLSPPRKMPLNANDVSFGNISKWQVSLGPSGQSFFTFKNWKVL
jgi:hypothetical protein